MTVGYFFHSMETKWFLDDSPSKNTRGAGGRRKMKTLQSTSTRYNNEDSDSDSDSDKQPISSLKATGDKEIKKIIQTYHKKVIADVIKKLGNHSIYSFWKCSQWSLDTGGIPSDKNEKIKRLNKTLNSYTFENLENFQLNETAFSTSVKLSISPSASDLVTKSRKIDMNANQFKVLVGKSQNNGSWFLFQIPKPKDKNLTATKRLSDGNWVKSDSDPFPIETLFIKTLFVVVIYPGVPSLSNNKVSQRQVENTQKRRWKKDHYLTSKWEHFFFVSENIFFCSHSEHFQIVLF